MGKYEAYCPYRSGIIEVDKGASYQAWLLFSSDIGFGEGQSIAPPTQIIDVQEILKQANKPIDILDEYAGDAILTGGEQWA